MSWLSFIVYIADVFILGTYGLMAALDAHAAPWVARRRTQWFHWANAAGGVPTLWFEVTVHAWPVIPLTATFCVLGIIGTWRTRGAN